MKASTFLLGMTTGIVGGVCVTLFSTPQSGKELRSTIKSNSLEWKDKFADVKVQVDGLKNSIANLTKETKETIPQVVGELKESIQSWQTQTVPHQEKLQEEIAGIQQSIADIEKTLTDFRNRKQEKSE